MDKSVCLFGAGGHSKVIKDIALSRGYIVNFFLVDNPTEEYLHNIPIVNTKELESFSSKDFIIAIGSNKVRKRIAEENKINYISLIHSKTIVSHFSTLGKGTVLMPNAVINSDVSIGKHVIVNSGAIIEHDCQVGDYVHISPNATITGGVSTVSYTHLTLPTTSRV